MTTAASPSPELFAGGSDPAAAPAQVPQTGPETGKTNPVASAADPTAPAADAPWWERAVPGKWKTEEDAIKGYSESSKEAHRLADEAKAASEKAAELETWRKGVDPLIGAPKAEDGTEAPYDWGFPPEATVDKTLLALGEKALREMNLSSEVAKKLAEPLAQYEANMEIGRRTYEHAEAVKALGGGDPAVAEATAKAAMDWAASHPAIAGNEELLAALDDCGKFAAPLKVLAALHRDGGTINNGRASGVTGVSEAEYKAIIAESGYHRDPEKMAKVAAYLNAKAPGGSPKEQDDQI